MGTNSLGEWDGRFDGDMDYSDRDAGLGYDPVLDHGCAEGLASSVELVGPPPVGHLIAVPEGWRTDWVSRFDPGNPDNTEDWMVCWDPEVVRTVVVCDPPLAADRAAELIAHGWRQAIVDGTEVWLRPAVAVERKARARRRHPSSRPLGRRPRTGRQGGVAGLGL